MCGIIGIIGRDDVAARLVEGLGRLEYRGYDSAGIATLNHGVVERRREEGKLVNLAKKLKAEPLAGQIGIGHTRWATHGGPSERNAHPHMTSHVAVVHNGIIENYAALKTELERQDCRFETDTDTEVVVHLVTHNLKQGMAPIDAANAAFDRLQGAYALAVIFANENDMIVGVRQGTPLAVGYGDGEMYVASDSYALAPLTRKVTFLEDGDRIVVTKEGVRITDPAGHVVDRPVRITAQPESGMDGQGKGAGDEKGGYPHFMLKEIFEQPAVLARTLDSFIDPASGRMTIDTDIVAALSQAPRITLVACGTAFYACMVAKYWFEQVARVPCEIDIASEFRYREAPMPENGAAIFVSQSGETLDTLEALRYCKRQGQTILSIVNTIESTIERESCFVLHGLAGPEIGVASTKAFTTQLATLACLVLAVAAKRKTQSADALTDMTAALRQIPDRVQDALQALPSPIEEMAAGIAQARDILYLGRNALYPLALEGALKLKEVSYIHAEAYAAGEMKHGPIALIDQDVPVVVFAPHDSLFEKNASNIQEIMARGGQVLLLSDHAGQDMLQGQCRWTLTLPAVHSFVAPILYAVPAQLLAYYIALCKGADIDQPRNLAKSVTVE